MRDYCYEGHTVLGNHGENLSSALFRLLAGPPGRAVQDWPGELVGAEFENIDFERTELRSVMFYLLERSGFRIPARSVSDGTLRFLSIVCALLTRPENSLFRVTPFKAANFERTSGPTHPGRHAPNYRHNPQSPTVISTALIKMAQPVQKVSRGAGP